MLIGYARVSTEDQLLDLQLDALRQVGCERVFTDKAAAAKTIRGDTASASQSTAARYGLDQRAQGGRRHDQDR